MVFTGIYFTSYLAYAHWYAKEDSDGLRPIIIALTIPGNMFPVVERADDKKQSFMGKPCHTGYQSHDTVVHRKGKKKGHVAPPSQLASGQTAGEEVADELVVFESAQALVKYVIYVH